VKITNKLRLREGEKMHAFLLNLYAWANQMLWLLQERMLRWHW
jgi:hypothetical protein